MNSQMQRLSILRGILKEFSLIKQQTGAHLTKENKYLMDLYRANQVTAAKYCRDQQAANYNASTFYCLLKSTREYDQLCSHYNRGEDSIKKAAERVGFQLPEDYMTDTNIPEEKETKIDE